VSPAFLTRRQVDGRPRLRFFFIAFIPMLPDDAICLVAGLTSLPLSALLLAAAVGRLPALAVSVWMGANAGVMPPSLLVAGTVGSVVLLVLAWRYGAQIETAVLNSSSASRCCDDGFRRSEANTTRRRSGRGCVHRRR
jgi:uncharacterized membrane protein YdjX (TVP38/TMEM64 family)